MWRNLLKLSFKGSLRRYLGWKMMMMVAVMINCSVDSHLFVQTLSGVCKICDDENSRQSSWVEREPTDFLSLHKKWRFPLRISSVNVTKSANPETANLVTLTEEILNGKLHFLCSAWSAVPQNNLSLSPSSSPSSSTLDNALDYPWMKVSADFFIFTLNIFRNSINIIPEKLLSFVPWVYPQKVCEIFLTTYIPRNVIGLSVKVNQVDFLK